jgi:hypothetical protein
MPVFAGMEAMALSSDRVTQSMVGRPDAKSGPADTKLSTPDAKSEEFVSESPTSTKEGRGTRKSTRTRKVRFGDNLPVILTEKSTPTASGTRSGKARRSLTDDSGNLSDPSPRDINVTPQDP